jgi:hypothetical protein
LEELDAVQASSSAPPVRDVDSESIHSNDIDKREFLGRGIALGQGTSRVAKRGSSTLGVSIGQVQDAAVWKCCEAEGLGTAALEVGVVQLDTSWFEAKAEFGFPGSRCLIGQQPGGAGALRCIVGFASDGLGVGETCQSGVRLGGDVRTRNGDDLVVGVVLAGRHGRCISTQAIELSSENYVLVRCLDDGVDGAVEAVEGQILPAVLPDEGVGRVAAIEASSDVDLSGVSVAVERVDGSSEAFERGNGAIDRVKQGNASGGLHLADAREVACKHDSFRAIDLQGAHGLDIGIGDVDRRKHAVGVAGEESAIAAGVLLTLALELV